MSRAIIKVHTIAQWNALSDAERIAILTNIRLKDRLLSWIKAQGKKPPLREAKWVRCRECNPDHTIPPEQRGYIYAEPRYDGIHPSQIGDDCLLKIYNELVGVEKIEDIEPRLQVLFDLGKWVHRQFQDYGHRGAWGSSYESEVCISGEFQEMAAALMLEGHADAENILVVEECPGPIYEVGLIHEYKTINEHQFSKLRAAKPKHRKQALLYSAILDRPIVTYLYMNKNDSQLKDFPVPYSGVAWEEVLQKIRVLLDHYQRRTAPPADVGYHCEDCGFAYTCEAYAEHKQRLNKR